MQTRSAVAAAFCESARRSVKFTITALALCLFTMPLQATVTGRIVDSRRQPVGGAFIAATGRFSQQTTTSDAEGRFTLPVEPPVTVRVTVPGFLTHEALIEDALALDIVLDRLTAAGEITVTASRSRLPVADSPSSTVVVSREELQASASPVIDDALRAVPGFTLFRRSGSRTANPTSQGVSLRGVGASGASRTSVLDEGIPLNDAFGGWVYWGRVPVAAIDRIEVVRGGSSDLFGGSALSGVIQMVRRSDERYLVADLSGGDDTSSQLSVSAAERLGAVILRVNAEHFATEGYIPVRDSERGAVDIEADVERQVIEVGISHQTQRSVSSFARLSFFDESRSNGTALQRNATRLWSAAAGLDMATGGGLAGSLRAFATDQQYEQTFSAIALDRTSERLTLEQQVPSSSLGISAHAIAQLGERSTLVVGGEVRQVKGQSDEEVFSGTASSMRSAGGTQTTGSIFIEDVVRLASNLTLVASARYDGWRNADASRTSGGVVTTLGAQSSDALSPRLALLYRVTDRITLTSSAYGGFRAPTLNELYRSFRLGNVVTNANEELEAERVRGYEIGARCESTALTLRANIFSMTTSDLIGNVTISATPALITRQRQNIGTSRTNGLELDAEWRPLDKLRLTAGYLFADGEVVAFAANPSIVGKLLPQVARHQASARANYRGLSGAQITSELRWSGPAFEDDRNELPLASYTTIDVSASKDIATRWTLYGAVENALNEEIESGRTPVTTTAQPRSWRIGLRYSR